jgi:hypothetical protein
MGVLGKLGEVLGADVGSLVKDAGKVLNTDVGGIVKGAGKALNADVGDIVKGAGTLLRTDVGDLIRGPANEKPAAAGGTQPATAAPAAASVRAAETSQRLKTVQTTTSLPQATPPAAVKVTEDLVTRKGRAMPSGRSLSQLLPVTVGTFRRDADKPTGDIAGDPVVASYMDGSEIITLELAVCWDREEAVALLGDAQGRAGAQCKVASDYTWLIGQGPEGAVLAWVRDTYFYLIHAPKGPVGLVRFATQFPF